MSESTYEDIDRNRGWIRSGASDQTGQAWQGDMEDELRNKLGCIDVEIEDDNSWASRTAFIPKFAHQATEGYDEWISFKRDREIICIEKSTSDEPDLIQNQETRDNDGKTLLNPEALVEMNTGGPAEADWFVPDQLPFTHEHIEQLGDWPQRLLYLPTMISHEWTAGNTYNGHASPRFRAISYTWGRWRLRPGHKPRIGPALTQSPGVPWDTPRIDTVHFTPAQLRRALHTVCNPDDPSLPPVDFVWLDLVCIDQRRGPLSMREVGRQAGIFALSDGVAVWLSHVLPAPATEVAHERPGMKPKHPKKLEAEAREANRLQILHKQLDRGLRLLQQAATQTTLLDMNLEELQAIHWCVSMLLHDPWWSSLWTLQEAILGRHSFFILGDGMPLRGDGSAIRTLQWFSHTYLQAIQRATSENPSSGIDWMKGDRWVALKKQTSGETRLSLIRTMMQWLDTAAISSIASPDGFVHGALLLGNARYRVTSQDTDRIYGIQQVFRYQLGSTHPEASPHQKFTLRALEDEFGALMLRDEPIRSQLFMFVLAPVPGRGWRVNQECQAHPELTMLREFQVHYKASTRMIAGMRFGYFQGRVCSFVDINRRWDVLLEEGWQAATENYAGADHPWRFTALRRFYPDIVNPLLFKSEERQEARGPGPVHIPDEQPRQIRFGRFLERRFQSNRLIVLHLGCSGEKQIGLLLVQVRLAPANVVFWYRLGQVVWYSGRVERPTSPGLQVSTELDENQGGVMYELNGKGPLWQEAQGIFG